MRKEVNQKTRVMDYMNEYKSITSLEAFRDLGVTRLSAVIFDIKKSGVPIKSERMQSINRFGEVVYFSKYSIITEEEDV